LVQLNGKSVSNGTYSHMSMCDLSICAVRAADSSVACFTLIAQNSASWFTHPARFPPPNTKFATVTVAFRSACGLLL
jgi:hypothetical protein